MVLIPVHETSRGSPGMLFLGFDNAIMEVSRRHGAQDLLQDDEGALQHALDGQELHEGLRGRILRRGHRLRPYGEKRHELCREDLQGQIYRSGVKAEHGRREMRISLHPL